MNKNISLFVLGATLCLSLTSLGCGESGPTMATVTGNVTFDGKPVESGQIIFKPTGEGTAESGSIENGKYSVKVTPGSKRVEISATRESGVAPDGLPNYESYIPAQYNSQSTLTKEVKVGGENKFDFDLTTGGK